MKEKYKIAPFEMVSSPSFREAILGKPTLRMRLSWWIQDILTALKLHYRKIKYVTKEWS